MTDTLARVMFGVTVLLLVPVLVFLYVSSQPPSDARQVVAQFEDAFPLVEGMNVRVDGAIAGSVGPIAVNDDGLAEVTLLLEETIEPARADASAAIRQQDTTGDSYVAFEPGKAKKQLREVDGRPTIACNPRRTENPCPNTLVAPRFDDLLNSFGPAERSGIQLMLTELARAVDGRGKDLNRAALDLRPGLAAANRALADVNRQNAALKSFITDAEAVSGQAASRSRSLGRSIESLASTLSVTADETRSLDAGLARLPATARRARTTLSALRRAAVAARPLAEDLRTGAPLLATAVQRAPAFLGDVESFLTRTRPTLDLTHDLIRAGGPTIEAEPSRIVTGPFDLAPAISNLLRGVLGEDETIEVLFNKKFGLGAVSQEPGNQPGYPAEHADRHFVRVSALLNCEGFGVPVKPGCLLGALTGARAQDRDRSKKRAPRRETPAAAEPQREEPAQRSEPPAKQPDRGIAPTPPKLPSLPALPQVPQLPGLPTLPQPPAAPQDPGRDPTRDLLDFLLK